MTQAAPVPAGTWSSDWQNNGHADHFDARSVLPPRSLIRNYEAFSDVRMLAERLSGDRKPVSLLEVGCATGEFHRYLCLRHPRAAYYGIDISLPAVTKARQKYPQGRFYVSRPEGSVEDQLISLGIPARPEILYSKDVLHHQTDPFGFLSQLLDVPTRFLILRTRTREKGATELDPELSCQYHYQGWMPYIVFNREELVQKIHSRHPRAEISVQRNPMVLGGRESRFLPKECYLPETGTAETAVGIFLQTDFPGRVQVTDRMERLRPYPLTDRLALYLKKR